MGLSFSIDERIELAHRLGIDPPDLTAETLLREAGRLAAKAARATERSYADADHEILKLDSSAPVPATRTRTRSTAADALIDGAIARGAIPTADREAWHRQYAAEPALVREIVERLPSDPAMGERAFASDPRLRDLQAAFDDYLGTPEADRVRAFSEPDEDGVPADIATLLRLDA